MLIAECLWYAGVTVFLSVGIGGILGWIFDYVISNFNIFGELSYQFPLMETVVFVLALLVVTGIFSVVAVRYSKRLFLCRADQDHGLTRSGGFRCEAAALLTAEI